MADNGKAYPINLESFSKRLKMLYAHWDKHYNDLWGGSQVLAIATPPPSDDLRNLKSTALNLWLVGYEFPDTIMLFTKMNIHVLCSRKKASLLEVVKKSANVCGVEFMTHVKAKNVDGVALMESIFRAIHARCKVDGRHTLVLGHIAKEAPEGILLETWDEKLKNSNFQLRDVTGGFSDLFAVKDDIEITNLKKAGYLISSVMKQFVVPTLKKVIDEEQKVSHSSLMEDTEKVMLEPAKIKVKLKADNVDICYPPIFQSGGEFDLKPSASSNDRNLYYDSTSIVICAIGSRYNSYCANVARSFLFDATPMQKNAYSVLLKAHGAAIAALKPGNSVGLAYQAASAVVEKEEPELIANLTKSAGTGIGLEFCESGYILNGNNEKILKAGMVFNVSLGFQNLQVETKNPKTEKFSLLLADTVIVGQSSPEVITSVSSKTVKDVVYSFNEDDDDEQEEQRKIEVKSSNTELLPSKATLVSEDDEDEDSEMEDAEEEGKTWEELEREASNADREKGHDSDSEEDRKRRKMTAFGKSRPPEPRRNPASGSSSSLSKQPRFR